MGKDSIIWSGKHLYLIARGGGQSWQGVGADFKY